MTASEPRIRCFRPEDAEQVSALIRRNFLEVNIRDYPAEQMRALSQAYDAAHVLSVAKSGHTYVAERGNTILATGSIAPFWGSETESILLSIFVLPECHGHGIGRKIVETLEADEYFIRASRVEIPASVTAVGFYEKLGYRCKNGSNTPDGEGNIRMEKNR